MSIEHLDRQKTAPGRADDYSNCYYACRFCNRARGTTERLAADGRALLDPCADAWGAHFELQGDELRTRTEAAVYTHETYRLDDARRKQMRRARRTWIPAALETFREAPGLLLGLLARAAATPEDESLRYLKEAQEVRKQLRNAREQLERFAAVPTDSRPCRCGASEGEVLPKFLSDQVLPLPTAT